jgi:hypothetical protein
VEEEEGDFVAETLRKVVEEEEVGDYVAQTLRKVEDEEEEYFVAQLLR